MTKQELDLERQHFQRILQPMGVMLNDMKCRLEAMNKTLIDAGLVEESKFERNRLGIRGVQGFLTRLQSQQIPMSQKIEQVIAFNIGQEMDFRITDKYFPDGKTFLVSNPENLGIDTIIRFAQGLGISDDDIEEMMVQIKAVEEMRAEQGRAGEAA